MGSFSLSTDAVVGYGKPSFSCMCFSTQCIKHGLKIGVQLGMAFESKGKVCQTGRQRCIYRKSSSIWNAYLVPNLDVQNLLIQPHTLLVTSLMSLEEKLPYPLILWEIFFPAFNAPTQGVSRNGLGFGSEGVKSMRKRVKI